MARLALGILLLGLSAEACPHEYGRVGSSRVGYPLPPGSIQHRIEGTGPETLVLIPGLTGGVDSFDAVIHRLAEKYRVIVYSPRGHGTTPTGGTDFSTKRLADDLAQLLDELGVKKATVLGHSVGSATAVRFAANYPERTQALILGDYGLNSSNQKVNYRQLKRARELDNIPLTYPSKEDALKTLGPLLTRAQLKYLTGPRKLRVETDGSVRLLFSPATYLRYEAEFNAETFTPALKAVHCPTLVLRADPVHTGITPEGVAHLRRHLANVRVQTLKGAKHDMAWSSPDLLVESLFGFLKEVTP